MTVEPISETVLVTAAPAEPDRGSYVDWPAILGGVALATAISLVLLAFGSAIGLSFTSFRAREGASPIWMAVAAASWLLWVEVSSFMAGGYLTGRLRRRFGDSSEHESDVRDGAHGLLVWAGGLVLGALMAAAGLGVVANAAGNVAGAAVAAAPGLADEARGANAYLIDTLFRAPVPAATPGLAAAPAAPLDDGTRAEATRILAEAATRPVPQEDADYLAALVARQTGLPEAEAKSRVDAGLARFEAAKAEAVAAAETARKTGVVGAFLIAASLFVSAVGAWWAASMGGRHRNEGTVFATFFRRY